MEWLSKLREARPEQWIGDYLRRRMEAEPAAVGSTIHVMFMFADHWEPSWGGVSDEKAAERTRDWATLYPRAARSHVDADGRHPAHSFFYPWDEYRRSEIEALAELSAGGFGEVEVHLHHRDDTSDSLRHKLEDAVGLFRSSGCLGSGPDGRTAYGFVHGDWALDNSRSDGGRNYCGVNDEIRILAQTGCYADYTFPSLGVQAQPRWVNRFMRVTDDPLRPKSYEHGVECRVGPAPECDLMLVPGPVSLHRPGGLRIRLDDGQMTGGNGHRPDRADAWLKAHVHVKGRPEWVFVKLHTHGCTDRNCPSLLGQELDRLWTDLERRYNDGERYRLHYVTAREAYNIARAAEDGRTGDPGRYRDYEIAAPPCRGSTAAAGGRELEMVR